MDHIAEDIEYLRSCGMDAEEIAERLGVNLAYVEDVVSELKAERERHAQST